MSSLCGVHEAPSYLLGKEDLIQRMNAYDACHIKSSTHWIIIETVLRDAGNCLHFDDGSIIASTFETTEFCTRHRTLSQSTGIPTLRWEGSAHVDRRWLASCCQHRRCT